MSAPVLMIVITGTLFAFFKGVTIVRSRKTVTYAGVYALGWVGMDPEPFCTRTRGRARSADLVGGAANLAFGLLLWAASYQLDRRLTRAWVLCAAIAFSFHFGLFRLLAWGLCKRGFAVEPIMKNPLGSRSVQEFWGGRWNRAFHDFAGPHLYEPLRARLGKPAAIWGTFLISGLLHELMVSVPAQGGWGLPTLYFLLQPLGMAVERPLPEPLKRVAAFAFTAGPAALLFHTPYMMKVVLPLGGVP